MIDKSNHLAILIACIFLSACSVPIKTKPKITSVIKLNPIDLDVTKFYMNHIEMTPVNFHQNSKLIFESYFDNQPLSFSKDIANDKESLLSTNPIDVSSFDLIKYGFVDGNYSKGKIIAIGRSVLHPYTQKIVTGYGFFLYGWNGVEWSEIESNRMYEQRAYNMLEDISKLKSGGHE